MTVLSAANTWVLGMTGSRDKYPAPKARRLQLARLSTEILMQLPSLDLPRGLAASKG